MSRDEFSLPTVSGAEETPGLGGPALPQQAAEGISLRSRVMEPINDVLFDPAPEAEWARPQLRKQLAAPPDNPERAFLEHLIGIGKHGPGRRPFPGDAGSTPAGRPVDHGTQDRGMTKRVMSVVRSRLLLTAFSRSKNSRKEEPPGLKPLHAVSAATGLELEMAALQSWILCSSPPDEWGHEGTLSEETIKRRK